MREDEERTNYNGLFLSQGEFCSNFSLILIYLSLYSIDHRIFLAFHFDSINGIIYFASDVDSLHELIKSLN